MTNISKISFRFVFFIVLGKNIENMCLIHTFLPGEDLEFPDYILPVTLRDLYADTPALRQIVLPAQTEYLLFYLGKTPVRLLPNALDRLVAAINMSQADMVYTDYYKSQDHQTRPHPTLEYQPGSVRDDFDFGPLFLIRRQAFVEAVQRIEEEYRYAAFYDLRLKISQKGNIFHLPEFLYVVEEDDPRQSGEKQFDYVNPRNRAVQAEMEKAFTAHLKAIGAWLAPDRLPLDLGTNGFGIEASIVIPVKNRNRTIAEAVRSALSQKATFRYNVIVVDNYSTDGTTRILQELSQQYPDLVHLTPAYRELGIGGCWNEAINHTQCGKFAVQLDSDDLYNGPDVLQTIIDTFYEQQCAMVIGSYQMVNYKLEEIPPGIIDHREWTAENGMNNALRVNGLGAPRAFYTPLLRQLQFPNVSYGEDYAVGLALSRNYKIGRIYRPLYLCRRWEENSDACLDVYQQNHYNFYKDKIRTLEILQRISQNRISLKTTTLK